MNKEYKKRLIYESSFPGTMSLLFEDESQVEDAQQYSRSAVKAIKARLTKMTSLVGSLPTGGYRSGLEALINKSIGEKINTVIEKTKGLTDPSENLESAAKEAGVLASEIDEASKDINTTIKINLALMRYMATQILKSNLHKGEDKDVPMEEILKGTDDKLLDVAIKELGEAFDQAFKKIPSSKEKKGFFAKLGDALFGSDEPVFEKLKDNKDELVKSILELTPIEIGKFAQAIVNYGKEDDKEAEKVEKQSSEAREDVSDEASGENPENETTGASISKKELRSKAKEVAGEAGALVVDKLLASEFFKEFNITEGLRAMSLQVLLEQTIPADDYTDIVAQAMEDNEDAFSDTDSNSLAKDLNKLFKNSDIDIEIEEKPLTWNDLDNKSKRRATLAFYLGGEYQYGGKPSSSTMESLLFAYQREGLNAEDLADTDVDINNTFMRQKGKGAEKLGDIPELVDLVNSVIDKKTEEEDDRYKDLRLENKTEETEQEETEQEDFTVKKYSKKEAQKIFGINNLVKDPAFKELTNVQRKAIQKGLEALDLIQVEAYSQGKTQKQFLRDLARVMRKFTKEEMSSKQQAKKAIALAKSLGKDDKLKKAVLDFVKSLGYEFKEVQSESFTRLQKLAGIL